MTTPTALPTLTDEELSHASGYDCSLTRLRNVQAAVHAKLLPYFAQREREAERAAIRCFSLDATGTMPTEYRVWLDKHFPPLPAPSSREITLSDGCMFQRTAGRWYVKGNGIEHWSAIARPACYTAADHDKCAELLRMEEQ